jgi:hypothetical protein
VAFDCATPTASICHLPDVNVGEMECLAETCIWIGYPRVAGRRPVLISLSSMATAASPRSLVSLAAPARKFYTGMAIVMLFTALVGFSRTYFLGLISGHATTITGRVPNATVHLHALLFMSWLVLFICADELGGDAPGESASQARLQPLESTIKRWPRCADR